MDDYVVTTDAGQMITAGDEVWNGRDAYTFQYISRPPSKRADACAVVTDGWGSLEFTAANLGLCVRMAGNTDGM